MKPFHTNLDALTAERSVEKRLRAASFTGLKTLVGFDWASAPALPRERIEQLATGNFVRAGTSVLFLGLGHGKSHLAEAIAREIVALGLSTARRRSFVEMGHDLGDLQTGAARAAALRRYEKPHLLVLEDEQMERLTSGTGEALLDILTAREGQSTFITSSRPLSHWDRLFGHPQLVNAALDLLLHRAVIIQFGHHAPTANRIRSSTTQSASIFTCTEK